MDPRTLGFETWLDIFEYLNHLGFGNEARVGFTIPPTIKSVVSQENVPTVKAEPSDIVLDMITIRARAFDELYQRLPFKKSQEVLSTIAEDIAESRNSETEMAPVIEFINKIPTRKNYEW